MAEDIVERLPVRTRHYKYSDPVSGKPVWRNEYGTWNGQRPKGSVELYDRQTVELAIAAQRAELDRLRAFIAHVASLTRTDETTNPDLENDEAIDGLIAEAREIRRGK